MRMKHMSTTKTLTLDELKMMPPLSKERTEEIANFKEDFSDDDCPRLSKSELQEFKQWYEIHPESLQTCSKESISVLNDDGEELLDPHEQDWFKKAEASDSPGKNMRMFRRFAKLTQPQLADRLGTSKQAISNMENGIRPISKKTAKELARIFRVSVSNFI